MDKVAKPRLFERLLRRVGTADEWRARLRKWAIAVLLIAGGFTFFRLIVVGPTTYHLCIETERADALGGLPPIFVVQSRWWGWTGHQYAVRFRKVRGWEWLVDARWQSLPYAVEKDIGMPGSHYSVDPWEDVNP